MTSNFWSLLYHPLYHWH